MNKHLTYLLLLIFPLSIFAQRQHVGLSIGPSIPLGDFAKTDIADSTSGWAKTGVMLTFNYSYRVTHNFGLTAILSYSTNRFHSSSYRTALELQHQDTTFSVISESNWNDGGILIGPYLRFPLSSNLSWDVRGLFGFYGSTSPRILINPYTDNGQNDLGQYIRQRASAFSYAFMIGTGFKYELSKYYVLLFADYTSSSLKFKNGSGWDYNDQPYTITFSQNISYLSVTLGLGYFF